ncbi:MMPL family transporter [Acidimicrobiia bacterium]|jgi:predicted RND superfamily exporter protein|nr:MMPL family transporter [Candidatus Actinomarina sp.]MDA8923296.1 MMPL family transporter [Acidimicrobiia bacterium]MDC3275353.1 MMPL family transporter [bacterium]MDA9017606.1 MMPL family transporter [Acidimicrobiia bacterium]MDA9845026.1 MMPL family transporter [Acidimicrobiia bacterium]|tara:strand:+ start:61 stop:2655 length:2595 start_codon:yes stop_codon:yes gene_type:complete
MKTLTNFFSSAATKRPVITILVVLLLTGFFGYMATQAEELSTSFGGELDTPEIQAQSKLGDYFASSGGQSVFQVIMTGDDVLTVDGYKAWLEIQQVVSQSEISKYLISQQGQGAVQGFFGPIDFARAFNPMFNIDQMNDEQFKQAYKGASAQMPPEFQAFASALLSENYDSENVTSTAGLAIITIDSAQIAEDFGGSDGAFIEQPRMEVQLSEELNEISSNYASIKVSGFSFGLLLGNDGDDFLEEIGVLFGKAFLIILGVLAYIFFIRPRKGYGFLKSSRRTVSDLLLSLGTILLSIGWMQGMGALLGPGFLNVIGAPNQISQIAPILLIGLGVDYAIHFTGRYREELGDGASVKESTTNTLSSVGIALTLATLATIVGFLSNVVSPLPEFKDFGITVSFGILFALLLVMTFVPAIRSLLDKRAETKESISREAFSSSGESVLNKVAGASSIIPRKLKVISIALLIGVSSYGYVSFSNLDTVFNFTDFLPEDDPVVATLSVLTDEFGGGFGETTSVLLEGEDLATSEIHNAIIVAINDLADAENIVVFGENVANESVIASLGALLAPQDAIPGSPPQAPDMELISGLMSYGVELTSGEGLNALKVSANGDVDGLYKSLLTMDPATFGGTLYLDNNEVFTAQQIKITTSAGSEGSRKLTEDIYAAFQPVIDLGVDVAATNDSIVTNSVSDLISASQFQSLIFAILSSMFFLIIYYWIDLKRPFLGVVTIFPVIAIVMGTYLGMNLLDIPLNPVTATLTGIAIGIGVPFVIHVTNRFREALSNDSNPVSAITTTLKTTGGSLFGSAFTTMAGFGILTTSTLKPFQQMGQVVLVSIGFALVASILILPTLLVLWANYHNKKTAKSL